MKPIEASVSVSELRMSKKLTRKENNPPSMVNVIEVKMKGGWDGENGNNEKFPISIHLTVPADGKPNKFFIGDELHISVLDECEHYMRNI